MTTEVACGTPVVAQPGVPTGHEVGYTGQLLLLLLPLPLDAWELDDEVPEDPPEDDALDPVELDECELE